MRPIRLAALFAATALCAPLSAPARAQNQGAAASSSQAAPAGGTQAQAGGTTQGTAQGAAQGAAKTDPVVAKVGGQEIRLSDVQDAMANVPQQFRNLPEPALFAMVLDRLIDTEAAAQLARKQGLDKDPAVHRQVVAAEDRALTGALLNREIGPQVSDDALRAVYERDYAHKPGEPEVHAAHILVASEDEAKKIIAQLKAGADFTELAKKTSTEPGAAQSGGDLGWFKQGDMIPAFSSAAFAMKPGEVSSQPVKTQYGWHVIKVIETRTAPPPSFDQVKDEIRQKLIQQGVRGVFERARAEVPVERFNADGTPMRPTDAAEPPAPAVGAAPGASPNASTASPAAPKKP